MPSAEREAGAIARSGGGGFDWEKWQAEYERALAERHDALLHDARASFRAVDGWGTVRSKEDWEDTVERASEDYARGHFLIDRLGAERYLDPVLMAVLLSLRRRLIDEEGATTAADLMMVDCAVLSYYHLLRVNGWIGDLATWLEAEFFRKESPTARFRKEYGGYGNVDGLRLEDIAKQIVESLMPLLDRANRMMLRNLKSLRERRQVASPSVAIGLAGQVNVATRQGEPQG